MSDTKQTVVKPEGTQLRKLCTLMRDTMSEGSALDLTDTVVATEFGMKIAKIQAMMNGQHPVELPEKVRVIPINEARNEKMRTRVQFVTTRAHARQAKEAIKTAYQLDYMPSAMSTEDANVVTISVYFVRFSPARRFFEAHQDIFIDLICHGKDAETPQE